MRGGGIAIALVALLVGACSPTLTPTLTPAPSASSLASAPAASSQPPPSPSASLAGPLPTPVAKPPPPTSSDKIRAAVAAGRLTPETGVLFRVFAIFADPRLPAEYRGESEEDLAALVAAQEGLATFPPDIAAQLRPYLLRPADPASAWSAPAAAATNAGGAVLALAHPGVAPPPAAPGAPTCEAGWAHQQVSPNVPVMIWGQCAGNDQATFGLMAEARGYMAGLYGPETDLMGAPIGDRNIANDGYPDTPETGDGLIDIYLISAFTPNGGPRKMDYGSALAVTPAAPPFDTGPSSTGSSAYIVVAPGRVGPELETVLAHEFFHVLQYRHNLLGGLDCPIGLLAAGCARADRDFHWFIEASATWSEEYFAPPGRPFVYPFFKEFLTTSAGLSSTAGDNEYDSFAWPLFMHQELRATSVADAWRAMEGKKGWRQFQGALDGQVSFKTRFRDFAVRAWNQELLPGDPIKPRFNSPQIDAAFPKDQPSGERIYADTTFELKPQGAIYRETLQSLASHYVPFSPGAGVHRLTFDFAGFSPELDADVLLKIADTGWERRKLPPGETVLCLDDPADAVEEGILVFSNHDQEPGAITRQWSAKAEATSCEKGAGTVTYTAHSDDRAGRTSTESLAISVKLKAAPPDSPFAAQLLNNGSTYSAEVTSHVVGPPGPDGCSPTTDSHGLGSGGLPLDGVVGNLTQPDGSWVLTLGASVPIHVVEKDSWCSLGSGEQAREDVMQLPSCDGVEIASATPKTRTFTFDCTFNGETESWQVSGSVVVDKAQIAPPTP